MQTNMPFREEKALLTSLFIYPEVQTIIDEGRRWVQANHRDSRKNFKDGTLKDAATCLLRLVEDGQGSRQLENEHVNEYHDRLWARANADGCLWMPARCGETQAGYLKRYRNCGHVSIQRICQYRG